MRIGFGLRLGMLVLLAVGLFLPGQSTLPPTDRDEARYIQATRQMLDSGDYVDIRFQDQTRYKKPIGIYWLQALAAGDSDAPIWRYRLPSLLGAVAAVVLTALIGVRLFGPTVGWIAAAMLAGCLLLGVEARLAKTDAVLLAATTLAQGFLARFYLDRHKPLPPTLPSLLGFWLAMGVGILVKGPITLMICGLTLVALWLADRQIGWVKRLRPGLGMLVVGVVVLPWLTALTLRSGGQFLSYAVGHEFLGKVGTGQESHWGPPGYHLLAFGLTFWPWAPLAIIAAPWAWVRRRDDAVRFCLAWIIPTWLVFEIVATKLPHYTLPLFPAIALLTAAALHAGAATNRKAGWSAWALGLIATLALALAALWLPVALPMSLTGTEWAVGLVAALALGIAGFVVLWQPRIWLVLPAAGIGMALVHGVLLPGLQPVWLSPRLAATARAIASCAAPRLSAAGYTEPSLVLAAGTDIFLGGGGEAAGRLLADPACGLAIVGGRDETDFLQTLSAAGVAPRRLATEHGFNYSRGQRVTLSFYTLAKETR